MKIDIQRHWGDKELYFVGELCARIIESMQKDGTVTLYSKEMRSASDTGLFFLLDQLSAYYNWDKSKITLRTGNYLEQHPFYKIEFLCDELLEYIKYTPEFQFANVEHRPWNHEKLYGMFLGRANVTRIHAIHKHKKFEFADQGLVSWHHNIRQQVDQPVLAEYLTATNQTYEEMVSVTPFSDIGDLLVPPITKTTAGNVNWASVYEKIGIELVFETSESPQVVTVSEKLLRPMLFKRPFMLIGGQHANQKFKNVLIPNFFHKLDPTLDVCFFENVFSKEYDNDQGILRVDHVFDILRHLVLTNRINNILEDCAEGIETNYRFASAVINNRFAQESTANPFDMAFCGKPEY